MTADGVAGLAKHFKTPAYRMRLHRARRERGLRCLTTRSEHMNWNVCSGRQSHFRARNGTTAMARTSTIPEATPVGPLSALSGPPLRLPQSISEMIRSRHANWLLCANTGRSQTARRTGEVDQRRPLGSKR
jgi:hypothetical protein